MIYVRKDGDGTRLRPETELLDVTLFHTDRVTDQGRRPDVFLDFDRKSRSPLRHSQIFGQPQKRTKSDGRN